MRDSISVNSYIFKFKRYTCRSLDSANVQLFKWYHSDFKQIRTPHLVSTGSLSSDLKINYMEMRKIKLKKTPLLYIGDKEPS